jgi:hypothetical protein
VKGGLLAAFEAPSDTDRKEYCGWIGAAKREGTAESPDKGDGDAARRREDAGLTQRNRSRQLGV